MYEHTAPNVKKEKKTSTRCEASCVMWKEEEGEKSRKAGVSDSNRLFAGRENSSL